MFARLDGLRQGALWKIVQGIVDTLLVLTGSSITLLIFSTVIARYFFRTDIYASEEIILTIAFGLYFAGSIKGSIEDSHIKADLLDVYLKVDRTKYLMKTLAKAVEFVVYVVLSKWAIDLIILNFQRMPRTPGLKIPIVVAQIPIAVGFTLMTVFALYFCLLYFFRSRVTGVQEGGE